MPPDDPRTGLDQPRSRDDPFDRHVRHAVLIERLKAGLARDTIRQIDREAFEPVLDVLGRELARIRSRGPRAVESKRVRDLRVRTRALITEGMGAAFAALRAALAETAAMEADWQVKTALETADVELARPTNGDLRTAALNRPMLGRRPREHTTSIRRTTAQAVDAAVTRGLFEGDTTDEILDRIVADEPSRVFRVARNGTRNMVDTGVTHASAQGRGLVASTNGDLVDAEVWVSVLDSATTPVCRARDGNRYPVGVGPRPPAHEGCRSSMLLVLRGEEPPEMIAYTEWLGNQTEAVQVEALGRERAKLWRAGKITHMRELVDQTGRPLRLDEIRGR